MKKTGIDFSPDFQEAIRKIIMIMKLMTFFLILGTLNSTADSYSQLAKMDLRAVDMSVEEILNTIESSSEFIFIYDANLIKSLGNKSINIESKSIEEMLNILFDFSNVGYMIDDRQVFLYQNDTIPFGIPRLSYDKDFEGPDVFQQQVRGWVSDSRGNPMAGVTVSLRGTSTGTFTDAGGTFTINLTAGARTLVFTYIGMKTQEFEVSDGMSSINVVMTEEMFGIDEVVVVALGITKEARALPYNVQKLDARMVNTTNDFSFINNLAGKVAGVAVNSSSTGIGGSSRVVMRGTKSLSSNNNSLYVVDGIPLLPVHTSQPGGIFTGMGQTGDGISSFNPEDIESISILSGPSAAALYGSEAANGVVMITTKKGASDGFSLDFNNSTTFYSPFVMPKFQNTYGESATGSYYSWGDKLQTPSLYDPRDFFQTGFNVNNSLSFSNGTDRNSFYFSVGSVNAEGIIENNDLDKYNVSFRNSTTFLNDRLTFDVSALFMNLREQNMLAQGQYFNPLIPVYLFPPGDDIRKYQVYERYNPTRDFKTQYWPFGDMGFQMQNPFWITDRDFFINYKKRYLMSSSLRYDINNWLNVIARARLDNENGINETRYHASTSTLFAGEAGTYYKANLDSRQLYADMMLNMNRSFEDLTVSASAGASIRDVVYEYSTFGGDLQSIPNLFAFKNINPLKTRTDQSGYHDQSQALFATAQVGYKNMVFLDLTGRNDWSTALSNTTTKSIFYPSVGLSGVITDIFDVRSNVLSFLKARISYSEVGNAPLRFISTTTYPVVDGYPQLTSYLPATNLEPERTKSYEAGLNFIFWDRKVSLDMTFYKSSTYNQLFNPSLSSSSGYSSFYVNAGRIDNKGIEAGVTLNQKLGPVDWSSNLIFSLNRNEIKELLNNYHNSVTGEIVSLDSINIGGTTGARVILKEGGTMGDIYVNTLKTDEHGYIVVGLATQAVISDPNRFIKAGTTNPKYLLGFSNTFSYKGINLSFLVNARIGGIGVSVTQAIMDAFGVSEASAIARDNGGALVNNYRIPAQEYYQTIGGGTSGIGCMYVYSASNVRVAEMSLGYDLPLKNKWIKGINVSLIGRNLLMFHNKAPYDPELTASTGTYYQGIDYFMQPSLRSMGYAVRVSF